jgi:adhesin transport system outer membrane protein
VAGKRAEVAAKGYAGDTARAQRYPSLSAQATANDNNTRPVATLRARQPLWAFGRIDAGIAYADADKAVDEADLLRVQRQLIDQTAVAYVRVLGARSRLAVAEDNVASLNALSEQIRRRHQGQLASLADVRLAEARLIQARAQRDRYAGELSVAENDLQALTQTPVQAVGAIPSSITQLPASSDIEALAVDQSTDMRLKAERVALARSDVDREKVATMPTVYLQGDRFFNQTGSAANMVMGLTIEASIDGLGFASKGRGEAAGARLIAAQEDLKASRMEVVRTVRSLLANRDLQQGLLDGQNLSVAELKELLASYQRQYQAGSKAWMDVLNMQRELTEQRLQAAQAESDWLMYTLKLAALTGRLDALAFSISKD